MRWDDFFEDASEYYDSARAAADAAWEGDADAWYDHAGDAVGHAGDAAASGFEDSTADELGEYLGLWEDRPSRSLDELVPYDPNQPIYGPVYDPQYGEDDMSQPYLQPTGAPQDGGAIMVPGVGAVDVRVVPMEPGVQSVSPMQAFVAIAQVVLRNPQILDMVRGKIGAVMRPAPTHSGGQPVDQFALKLMLDELDDNQKKPLAQYLAGFEAPFALTKKQEETFLLLKVTDALEANGIFPTP